MSQYWVSQAKATGNLAITLPDEAVKDYLFRESGALQQITHTKQALLVAKSPETQLTAFETDFKAILDTGVTKFKKDTKFLLDQGLPAVKAESLALQKISEELQREKAFLSLKFPLINEEQKLMEIQIQK